MDELVEVAERALGRVQLRREHSRLVSENLDLTRAQALYRQGLQILSTLDGERLQDVALSVLARVTDAQGAALWTADERGHLQLRAYRGVVDRAALPARVDPAAAEWAGPLRGGAPFPAPFAGAGEGFLVALVADDEPVGVALLSDRAAGSFGPEEHQAATTIADFTAIAVKNARRFQAVERVGLRERETGAYNLAYFVDYAGKEFYKARRYARSFSLVVLSIDNTEQMRSAAGREPYRRAVRDLVAAVTRVGRDADILAKVSESEYYVLLPETDYFGALMFLRRAVDEVRREDTIQRVEERCPVLLSMGAATFPKDGEDFDELLHWARARIQEQRGSLVRRLHLDDLDPPRSGSSRTCSSRAPRPCRRARRPPGSADGRAPRRRAAGGGARARPRSARARDALRRRSGRRRGRPARAGAAGRRRRRARGRSGRARLPARAARPRRRAGRAPPRHRGLPRRRQALRRPCVRAVPLRALRVRAPRRARRPRVPHLRRAARRRARGEAPEPLRPAAPVADRPKMASARKILIADPDAATVRALAPALRQRGYQVHAARDASRALQIAILRFPDLVLLDERAPLLDPRTFVRILRTNPRTERIPVVLTGETVDPERARLGTFLRKPFNLDEVLARIEQIFRRVDAARAVSGESREIEGNLAQIPIADLLQVLAVNRKTGRLTVERDGERAEIALAGGARRRRGDGRRGGREGAVAAPHAARGAVRVRAGRARRGAADRPARRGARARGAASGRRDRAPVGGAPGARGHPRAPRSTQAAPAGLHPVTEEVVALVAAPRRFQDVVDRRRASDLEAIRAIVALLEHGYVRRAGQAEAEAPPLLGAAEPTRCARASPAAGPSGAQAVGKVVVAGGGPLVRRAAMQRFHAVPGFYRARGADGLRHDRQDHAR